MLETERLLLECETMTLSTGDHRLRSGGYVWRFARPSSASPALVEKHSTSRHLPQRGLHPVEGLLESSDLFAAANHRFADTDCGVGSRSSSGR